jgi:hypothetical protein
MDPEEVNEWKPLDPTTMSRPPSQYRLALIGTKV